MQNFLKVTFSKKMSANYDDFSSVYFVYNIQLSPKREVNSGGYILRREASNYICSAMNQPCG